MKFIAQMFQKQDIFKQVAVNFQGSEMINRLKFKPFDKHYIIQVIGGTFQE